MTYLTAILALGSLSTSLAYVGYYQMRAASSPRSVSKGLATGLLAAVSLSIDACVYLTLALVLAAVGDTIKSRDTMQTFIAAMAIFIVVHLLMIAHIVLNHWTGINEPVFVVLALGGIAVGYGALIWPYLGARTVVIIPYISMILVLVIVALGAERDASLLKLGALIYLIAHCMLGLEMVVHQRAYHLMRPVGVAIWITYYAGLALMVAAEV